MICFPLFFFVSNISDMGNNNSNVDLPSDLVQSSFRTDGDLFKVDNINSQGRKHSTAKIQITNDDLCIRQKRRQSLHIPLETIRRYGIDGSIFILECGRRAPLGQARYAFRCKQAHRLVDCLDQRINRASEQILNRQVSSSTLTNVSSNFDRYQNSRRRTQSDYARSPSSRSLSSSASFYRNSEPDLSENYFAFDSLANQREPSINYTDCNPVSVKSSNQADLSSAADSNCTSTHQTNNNIRVVAMSDPAESSSAMKSYIFIDHDKTHALKDIAEERLQHHTRRIET